jgi:hypothetical protein
VPAARANESAALRPILGGEPLNDRDGVIRFQHRRKISSILIRNTVVPIAIRTTSGSCLAIQSVKSAKTRSCYEYHPPGRSKTVRAAVGRSIFPADGIGPTSKPAAGEGEQIAGPDRSKRKTCRREPAGPWARPAVRPAWRSSVKSQSRLWSAASPVSSADECNCQNRVRRLLPKSGSDVADRSCSRSPFACTV